MGGIGSVELVVITLGLAVKLAAVAGIVALVVFAVGKFREMS